MDPIVLLVVLVTVTLSAVAQLALKFGMSAQRVTAVDGGLAYMHAVVTSPFVWVGLVIYGTSVVAWLWVLSKVDVSVAYPFVGVSFVLTVVMAALFLHEAVTPLRIAGILLVIVGCILIARSAAT